MALSQNIFGEEWKQFAPHPLFNEWLPFAGTIIGLVSSLVGLLVAIMTYQKLKGKD
jgi:hypothetical protein